MISSDIRNCLNIENNLHSEPFIYSNSGRSIGQSRV